MKLGMPVKGVPIIGLRNARISLREIGDAHKRMPVTFQGMPHGDARRGCPQWDARDLIWGRPWGVPSHSEMPSGDVHHMSPLMMCH